jgi:hypothetical protein
MQTLVPQIRPEVRRSYWNYGPGLRTLRVSVGCGR